MLFKFAARGTKIKRSRADAIRPYKGDYRKMIDLTDETFDKVFDEKKPMIVLFWADWCPLCLKLIDLLEEMETEAGESEGVSETLFIKVDNEANEKLSDRFAVDVMPTVIAIADGRISDVRTGFREKWEYGEMIVRINNQQ
jgi:thioredoxin 1